MRLAFTILAVLASAFPAEGAPKVSFPYDATIETEETYVRSGPGSKYYPTGKLQKGDRVTVHRHDPGGWHMIAPPRGSFSWVLAKHVDKTADGRGIVNKNGVAARVGSFESDIREIFQRKLSQGDEVVILGEKQLLPDTGKGPAELWYRIAPPRGEWRWVSGQTLSPAPRDGEESIHSAPFGTSGGSATRSRAGPPIPVAEDDLEFAEPLPIARDREPLDDSPRGTAHDHGPGGEPPVKERPLVRREGKALPPIPAESSPRQKKRLNEHLEELDRLDARFKAILDQEPRQWDFDQLEQDYRRLHDEVDAANLQQMVDTRLTRIADYRKVRSEEDAAAAAAATVLRRDAELAEVQKQQEARLAGMRQPRFDGAGIIQRSALNRQGAPRHVLLSPNGKVLAYLASVPGLNLDAWLGRAVGVSGNRVRHPDLKADLITVVRVTPVRLSP